MPWRCGADTKTRLQLLYDGVEAGLFDPKEPALAERMAGLRGIHDQALADAGRIEAMLENAGDKAITPATIRKLAASGREKMRSRAAVIAASICVRWPSESRSRSGKFTSAGRRTSCCGL